MKETGRISGEILKIRSRQFRVAKIAKFRAEDSLQSLTYLAGSLSTPLFPSRTYFPPRRIRGEDGREEEEGRWKVAGATLKGRNALLWSASIPGELY